MGKKERFRWIKKLNFSLFVMFLCLIGGFVISIYSLDSFWRGFHNIDLAYNFNYVNTEFDLELVDLNNQGHYWTITEMYVTGLDQIQKGLYGGMIGTLFFGIGLGYLEKK